MLFNQKKLEEKISSTLFDLTHLEINTIIKDEMSATKAPASPRLILHDLSKKYHLKLISLGEKYIDYMGKAGESAEHLFRGETEFCGSAYHSFRELGERAKAAGLLLKSNKYGVPFPGDDVDADIMMLMRIETISDDIMRILKKVDTMKGEPVNGNDTYTFDEEKTNWDFRVMTTSEAEKYELSLDLRQLMVFKKANDIGTEKVVLQTIIGMDGDVTTRISTSFADHPVPFINQMHNDAIRISVDLWKTFISIVVELGTRLIGLNNPKK